MFYKVFVQCDDSADSAGFSGDAATEPCKRPTPVEIPLFVRRVRPLPSDKFGASCVYVWWLPSVSPAHARGAEFWARRSFLRGMWRFVVEWWPLNGGH